MRQVLRWIMACYWWNRSTQDLKQRLRETKQRGVVLREGESIEELYAEREELYQRFADVTVSEEGLAQEETVHAVMETL